MMFPGATYSIVTVRKFLFELSSFSESVPTLASDFCFLLRAVEPDVEPDVC